MAAEFILKELNEGNFNCLKDILFRSVEWGEEVISLSRSFQKNIIRLGRCGHEIEREFILK